MVHWASQLSPSALATPSSTGGAGSAPVNLASLLCRGFRTHYHSLFPALHAVVLAGGPKRHVPSRLSPKEARGVLLAADSGLSAREVADLAARGFGGAVIAASGEPIATDLWLAQLALSGPVRRPYREAVGCTLQQKGLGGARSSKHTAALALGAPQPRRPVRPAPPNLQPPTGAGLPGADGGSPVASPSAASMPPSSQSPQEPASPSRAIAVAPQSQSEGAAMTPSD
jgi:hypothetical protein